MQENNLSITAKGHKAGFVNIVGNPNVGKSTFINSFAGKACTKTGNKPGVTKGKQWIRLNKGLELLDTPGILWPKFEDPNVGMMLAYTGAVKEGVIDIEELSCRLMELLNKYLMDYAAQHTKDVGDELIMKELEKIPNPKVKEIVIKKYVVCVVISNKIDKL